MITEQPLRVGESRQTAGWEADRKNRGILSQPLLENLTGHFGDRHMRGNAGTKPKPRAQGDRQTSFSLHATLDQYEVEELDPREVQRLLAKDRRRAGRTPTSGNA
jgi:hypothetical protein